MTTTVKPDPHSANALAPYAKTSGIRGFAHRIVDSGWFQRVIITLILINAATLGLETSPDISARFGNELTYFDTLVLCIFVLEIMLRLIAYGWRFFTDPWSLFDFFVVSIALLPVTEGFAVLRALRILRVLRLMSVVPRMRRIVGALLTAFPGILTVMSLLSIVFYVAGVIATQLFGAQFPQWFGSLPKSLYSLFQIMTLESWSMGIVRPVMEVFPYAWMFFIPFILIATFTMLNLFIAVVVNAMQSHYHEEDAAQAEVAHEERIQMLLEVQALRNDVKQLNDTLKGRVSPD